jgi:hypothetical protein
MGERADDPRSNDYLGLDWQAIENRVRARGGTAIRLAPIVGPDLIKETGRLANAARLRGLRTKKTRHGHVVIRAEPLR